MVFFYRAQSCKKLLHLRALPTIYCDSTYIHCTATGSGRWAVFQRPWPITSLPGPVARNTLLGRGVQICGSLCERTVNCCRESANRADCRQGEQDQQQRLFRQVLAFLFFPKPHQKVLHECPLK